MEKIFRKTTELARAMYPAEFGNKRCFHISAIFDKTKLVIVAENQQKTHPQNAFNLRNFDIGQKNICSEFSVFLRAKRKFDSINWRKLTMINCRIDKNGNIRNSHPCPACVNLLRYVSPGQVFYSNDSGGFTKF